MGPGLGVLAGRHPPPVALSSPRNDSGTGRRQCVSKCVYMCAYAVRGCGHVCARMRVHVHLCVVIIASVGVRTQVSVYLVRVRVHICVVCGCEYTDMCARVRTFACVGGCVNVCICDQEPVCGHVYMCVFINSEQVLVSTYDLGICTCVTHV